MAVAKQVTHTYSAVLAQARPLSYAMAFWFLAAVFGSWLAVTNTPATPEAATTGQTIVVFLGHVINGYALLIGWYTAHRYLITGTMPESRLPVGIAKDMKAFEFVIAQVRNILLLTFISLLFLGPVTVYFATQMINPETEDVLRIQRNIALVALPIFVIFFSRLLLVAPLAARGELQAVSRSWRLTKGHFIRINILQLGLILPAVVTGLLGRWLQLQGSSVLVLVGAIIITLGGLFSIALYAQLAEDEYKKLVS